ncbi:MAG: hypothetical protein NC199_08320 [Bacteroides sp.]|nr:hypothetical protein [Bacteroides sp.]
MLTNFQVDQMTRLQATTLLAVMRERIHIQGKDSNGSEIGTYTPAYVKYTRAKKYKRGMDNKVILSLTRQMENGYELYPIQNGTAIGFTTKQDMQKAHWCEMTYQKPIFAPTIEEKELVKKIAKDYIAKHTSNV